MPSRSGHRVDILVQRQLDTISTGNGAYLETFLRVIKRAELRTRIVFAPRHSFGNRPWAGIHPRIGALIDEVVWPKTLKIGRLYWSLSLHVWMRFFIRALKAVLIKLGFDILIPSYLGRPLDRSDENAVVKVSNEDAGDITIAEYSSMGPVLDRLTTATRRGVLMHDLLSDRGKIWRDKGTSPDLYEISFEGEAEWCRSAELMIYASANELAKFEPAVPGSKSVWLRPEPPVYDETKSTGTPRVLYLGTTHAGNTDALEHFLADIWPLVLSRKPDLEFWIAGSVGKTLTDEERAQPGVKVLGRVERLEDVGGADSIGIAPTRLATGISIKVAEYLMLDMTCVAYPLAVQGFKSALNELVLLPETPEAFADAIVTLAEDHSMRSESAATSRKEAERVLDNQEVVDFLHAALPDR
ncbi:MAG: glycosyltransferase [Hyphomonadaceae bacterium]|nr:glycosyltransferase [Hyphomonadaceae bacterium]